jgi:hypothetical protein
MEFWQQLQQSYSTRHLLSLTIIAIPSNLETALMNTVVDRRKSIKYQFMEGLEEELEEDESEDEDEDESVNLIR